MVGKRSVTVNALGPEVDRGGSALVHDTGLGEGVEKAWIASQRTPCPCGNVLGAPHCPRHRMLVPQPLAPRATAVSTQGPGHLWPRGLLQPPSQGVIGTDVSCGYTGG